MKTRRLILLMILLAAGATIAPGNDDGTDDNDSQGGAVQIRLPPASPLDVDTFRAEYEAEVEKLQDAADKAAEKYRRPDGTVDTEHPGYKKVLKDYVDQKTELRNRYNAKHPAGRAFEDLKKTPGGAKLTSTGSNPSSPFSDMDVTATSDDAAKAAADHLRSKGHKVTYNAKTGMYTDHTTDTKIWEPETPERVQGRASDPEGYTRSGALEHEGIKSPNAQYDPEGYVEDLNRKYEAAKKAGDVRTMNKVAAKMQDALGKKPDSISTKMRVDADPYESGESNLGESEKVKRARAQERAKVLDGEVRKARETAKRQSESNTRMREDLAAQEQKLGNKKSANEYREANQKIANTTPKQPSKPTTRSISQIQPGPKLGSLTDLSPASSPSGTAGSGSRSGGTPASSGAGGSTASSPSGGGSAGTSVAVPEPAGKVGGAAAEPVVVKTGGTTTEPVAKGTEGAPKQTPAGEPVKTPGKVPEQAGKTGVRSDGASAAGKSAAEQVFGSSAGKTPAGSSGSAKVDGAAKVLQNTKVQGGLAVAGGVLTVLDAKDTIQKVNEAAKNNDLKTVNLEGSKGAGRLAGGWLGGVGAATVAGGVGAILGDGPGAVLGGFVGGVIGSYGGSKLGEKVAGNVGPTIIDGLREVAQKGMERYYVRYGSSQLDNRQGSTGLDTREGSTRLGTGEKDAAKTDEGEKWESDKDADWQRVHRVAPPPKPAETAKPPVAQQPKQETKVEVEPGGIDLRPPNWKEDEFDKKYKTPPPKPVVKAAPPPVPKPVAKPAPKPAPKPVAKKPAPKEEPKSAPSAAILDKVDPVKVTATWTITDDSDGNVMTETFVFSFWNVGAKAPGYSDAKVTQTFTDDGSVETETLNGTFSGGPNGTFDFGKQQLRLQGGAVIHFEGGKATVNNPEAFRNWPKGF